MFPMFTIPGATGLVTLAATRGISLNRDEAELSLPVMRDALRGLDQFVHSRTEERAPPSLVPERARGHLCCASGAKNVPADQIRTRSFPSALIPFRSHAACGLPHFDDPAEGAGIDLSSHNGISHVTELYPIPASNNGLEKSVSLGCFVSPQPG